MSIIDLFLDGEHRLRTVWRFLIYGVGFVGAVVFVQVFVTIGLGVYYLAGLGPQGANPSPEDFANWIEELSTRQVWLLMALATPPTTVLTLVLTCLCRRFLDWRSIRSMGYSQPENRFTSAIWAGLLWGLGPIVAAVCIPWLFGGFELGRVGFTWQMVVMVPTLVLAAYQEEFIFRGYVLQNLLDIRRPIFGVLFSSLVFWLVHAFNPSAWSSPLIGLNLFGAGVVLALAYMVSGNIWFPTAMHFGWNAAQGVLLSVPISGIRVEGLFNLNLTNRLPAWITGGEFGLEGSILVTVCELALIGAFLAVMQSRRPVLAELAEAPSHLKPPAQAAAPFSAEAATSPASE